jgi:hypothetical protein
MSCPLKTILPDTTGKSLDMVLTSVDLPAPFAPMIVTTFPASIDIETPCNASTLP